MSENSKMVKSFYLIDLKRIRKKIYWSWTGKNEWAPIENLDAFLSLYFPSNWHDFIYKELGLKENKVS